MEKIDGITRRVAKLEGSHKYPPLIVWRGEEQSIRPKPGQEVYVVSWLNQEPPKKIHDRR